MLTKYLSTSIGRLRLIGFLEGLSLLILVFIAVPMKYYGNNPSLVKSVGPVHGVLFLLFVFLALQVSVEYKWKLFQTTWKVMLASLIPFGTFYVDNKILKGMDPGTNK